jgi:tetratricopeptide (TPR) repeat protein
MARLADTLRLEGKVDKAEEMLDLAMEKMPIKHFGYLTLLNPIMEVYYKLDKPEKAREIWYQVAERYQDRLTYYASLDFEKQDALTDEISMDVQRYRSLVDMLVYVGDEDIVQKEAETFNSYLEKFSSPSGEMEAPDEDQMFQELLNSEDKAVNDTL